MTTTDHNPHAVPPPGAVLVDPWDREGERYVRGADRHVTDSPLAVFTSCFQNRDGSIQGDVLKGDEGPRVCLDQGVDLNADQARELAALLPELAAQIDGWVTK
jgi:hypothetical protein